jgi:hypothetical protein
MTVGGSRRDGKLGQFDVKINKVYVRSVPKPTLEQIQRTTAWSAHRRFGQQKILHHAPMAAMTGRTAAS